MGRTARAITHTELSLLKYLWQRRSATVQELAMVQYGKATPALLSTVRKLLDRMETEKCVFRDQTKWPHHYRAVMKREDLVIKRLQEIADELFDCDMASLLTWLVQLQKLTLKDCNIFR
jgi:predicted transcriptional regulator